jgi:hypothetical protein
LSKGLAAQPPSELVEDIFAQLASTSSAERGPFDKLRVTKELECAVLGPFGQLCGRARVAGAEDLA